MKEPIYQRRQRAALAPILLTGGVAIAAIVAAVAQPAFWVVAAALAVVGYLFSSMTITVDEADLRWHFGPGFWRKSVPLREIEELHPVRNSWWYGWGIRQTPHGWLYNVEGLEAVEFRLRDNRTFRLGTDDPAGLAYAVRASLERAATVGLTPPSA